MSINGYHAQLEALKIEASQMAESLGLARVAIQELRQITRDQQDQIAELALRLSTGIAALETDCCSRENRLIRRLYELRSRLGIDPFEGVDLL